MNVFLSPLAEFKLVLLIIWKLNGVNPLKINS